MARFLLLVALYLLGALLATAFIHEEGQVTLFWPSSGLAAAILVRYGLNWVWFVAVSVLLTHLLVSPAPADFIVFSVLSNSVAALVGAGYARHYHGANQLSVRYGLVLVRGAVLMAVTSALIGVAGLVLTGGIPGQEWLPALAKWALGDLLGILAVAPTVLMLTAPPSAEMDLPARDDYAAGRERAAWVVGLAISYLAVYLGGERNSMYALGLVSLPLTGLLWSAIRFPPLWTGFGTLATVLLLTTMTGLGMAGFMPPDDALDAAMLIGFMCLIATIPLVLAAASHERRVGARKLIRRATTDSATGLPNRTAFEQALRERLQGQGPAQTLAYMDLDHFTLVNDTASHAAGDALIRGIASLLETQAGRGEQVFRIGGDEFAVLADYDVAAAEPRARGLLAALERYRMGWEGHALNTTASIGLAGFQPGRSDFAQVLSQADAACFTAKELGGNQVCVASNEPGDMHSRTEAMRWAVRIREALDRGLFEVDCQTISPLHANEASGRHFEVLLRMRDPDGGERLMPGHFIPAAERFQLGIAIDRHVVGLVLGWLESHPEAAAEVATCAINLTAGSLVDEAFTTFLAERVRTSAVPASRLCFEVTETSAVRDMARAQRFISEMRALGCRFALDDFGTGFCSFNYLRTLDVDYFKIDGSFVRDLETSPLATAVVRSITDIAHVLRKQTIAEHTESDSVCVALRALGVDYAQGYAVQRPMPIDAYFAAPAARANIGHRP